MSPRGVAPVWLLTCLVTGPALAHSPIEGMGDFYNGLLHPLLVPAHLLVLLAMGLYLGQRGIHHSRIGFVAFLVAALVGLTVAWFAPPGKLEIALLGASAVIALLVVANRSVGRYAGIVLAIVAGLLVGLDSPQAELTGQARVVVFIGNALGILLLLLYSAGFADYCNRRSWQQIGVRVIGSWVTASALLVLALAYSRAAL